MAVPGLRWWQKPQLISSSFTPQDGGASAPLRAHSHPACLLLPHTPFLDPKPHHFCYRLTPAHRYPFSVPVPTNALVASLLILLNFSLHVWHSRFPALQLRAQPSPLRGAGLLLCMRAARINGARSRAKIGQKRASARHPAAPAGGGGYEFRCQLETCQNTFYSPSRQRRYCSDSCRVKQEQQRRKYATRINMLATRECDCPGCETRFTPAHARHRFCSPQCRSREYRAAQRLRVRACAWCQTPLYGKRSSARFCIPAHRMAHARAENGPHTK